MRRWQLVVLNTEQPQYRAENFFLLQWRPQGGVLLCRRYVARVRGHWPFSRLSGSRCWLAAMRHTILEHSRVYNLTSVFSRGCLLRRMEMTDVQWSQIRFSGSERRVVGSSWRSFPVRWKLARRMDAHIQPGWGGGAVDTDVEWAVASPGLGANRDKNDMKLIRVTHIKWEENTYKYKYEKLTPFSHVFQ